MKIAHCVRAVFPQHGYGGLERAGAALTRHLLTRDVDVALFTRALPPGQPFTVPATAKGRLTVHAIRYGRLPLRPNGIPARLTNYRAFVEDMGRRVEAFARKDYIDGIYAQGLCAWGVRAAAEWGVPMLANPQGMEDFKARDPLKRLAYTPFRAWVRTGCRAADRVIATDHSTRREVSALLGVDPARVVVIPNGVDIDEARSYIDVNIQSDLAARWPLLAVPGTALKGISVGRLEANKGFEYLLRALSAAKDSLGEDWTWIIVGDGSLRAALQQLASQLGLADHLHFAGQLSDPELHNLYEMRNLFAHPTLYEGSSLVTLEAMAHTLPVVASAVGGIPDKVIDGQTGFLVPPGEPAALADRISWMAGHPVERAAMGMRGAELAADNFSWDTIAAQTEELFVQLIDEKSACRPQRAQEARPTRC